MHPSQACFTQDFEEFHNSALTSLHPDTMCAIVRQSMGFTFAWVCSFSFLLPNVFLLRLWTFQITHILPGNDKGTPVLGKTKAKRGALPIKDAQGCVKVARSRAHRKGGMLPHFFPLYGRSVPLYLDSFDQTPFRKLTPILMDSRRGSVTTRTKIKKRDSGYSHDWHSASVFSHKALSLCLTCGRCIPKAFLQPTPHPEQ